MPVVSKAQNRWAHANEDAPGSTGKAAREFVKASHGKKLGRLPERKKPKQKKPARPFGSMTPTQAGHYDGDVPE